MRDDRNVHRGRRDGVSNPGYCEPAYPDQAELKLTNDGAGPALIRSAELDIDGKRTDTWMSIDASTTVRAGESRSLMRVAAKNPQVLHILAAHRLHLRFCYCSINNHCWQLDDTVNSESGQPPAPVPECAIGRAIRVGPVS